MVTYPTRAANDNRRSLPRGWIIVFYATAAWVIVSGLAIIVYMAVNRIGVLLHG